LEFSQITRTTPLRWMTLHLSQIFFTDALTFISFSYSAKRSFAPLRMTPQGSDALQTASFITVHNSSAIQVVRRKLNRHFVSRKDADEILAHFSGNVGQDLVLVFELHFEHGIRERFNYRCHYLNRVFFAHLLLEKSVLGPQLPVSSY
jgi:hypothetical protein